MWFKLDDKGAFHAKVVAAGNAAYGAWCRAGQWSSHHGTDGRIPKAVAHALARPTVWKHLQDVGLINECSRESAEYSIHDFLEYNPSAAQIAEAQERIRSQRSAAGKASSAQRERQRAVERAVDLPVNETATPTQRKSNPDPDPDPVEKEKEIPTPAAQGSGPGSVRKAQPRASKAEPKAATPAGYADLVAAYFAAFEEKKSVKPVFSARTGAAAKKLLGLMPLADAIACVRAAFADAWFVRTSGELWAIAESPNRYRAVAAPTLEDLATSPRKAERHEPLSEDMKANALKVANALDDLMAKRVLHG